MNRKYTFSVITLLVLTLGFAVYFFVYVKGQEESIHRRAFRILSKLSENITVLSETRMLNVRNNFNSIVGNEKADSASIKRQLDNPLHTINDIEGISDVSLDSIYHRKFKLETSLVSNESHLRVNDSYSNDTITFFYHYNINLPNLLEHLFVDALFEEYIILDTAALLFKSLPSGFHYDAYDSLLDMNIGMQVSSIRELEINGISYKLFLQPYQFDPENKWILGGLIQKETYNTLRLAIPPTIITFLFVAALLTIFSLPFLKLFFMGSTEQLYLSDAMYAGLSIILGTSILLMVFLNIHSRLADSKLREVELQELGDLIADRFRGEIIESYDQLVDFDNEVLDDCDVIDISDTMTAVFEGTTTIVKDVAAKEYPMFLHMYWIDGQGMQKTKWTTGSKNTPKINVSKRAYFKNVKEGNEWLIREDGDMHIAFESIFSWNSGKALVVVSKESQTVSNPGSAVIALATAFYSVIDPIVPHGYGFAIIDESADVLFHSDKNKNLQENFLTESEDNSGLRAALFGRIAGCLKINYAGERHGIYLTPVKDLPLYVIAFKNLNKDRAVHAQIMNFTFILIVVYFISFALISLVIRALIKPGSKLKNISYRYGWLMPRKNREPIYMNTIFMHVCMMLIVVLFLAFSHHAVYQIITLVTTSIYSFIYTFLRLNGISGKRILGRDSMAFLILLALIFVGVSIFSITIGYWQLVILQLALFATYQINFEKFANVVHIDCRMLYVLMLMSWLGITSFIPVLAFYKLSYEQEQELAVKHDQLEMAGIIADKDKLIYDKKRIKFFTHPDDSIHYLHKRKDVYALPFESIYFADDAKRGSMHRTAADSIYQKAITRLRARFNDYVIESSDLSFDASADDMWSWAVPLKNIMRFTYHSHLLDKPLILESALLRFEFPDWSFVVIFILIVIAIFHLIKFTVDRIFFDIKEDRLSISDERELFKGTPPDNRILLIGLSGPEKRTFISDIFGKEGILVDLEQIEKPSYMQSKLEEIKKGTNDLVVIDHLEYRIKHWELTVKKLDIISELHANKALKIVVTTSMELAHFDEMLKDSNQDTERDTGQVMNRLMGIFSGFYQLYCPLQQDSQRSVALSGNNKSLMDSLWDSEFIHGTYLANLKPKLQRITEAIDAKNDDELFDQTIHNVRLLAEPYYASLWSKCTKKEKYVLFDLADDGLVNPRNTKVISKLLNKGLIIYTDKLRIMNESFRDFVRSGLEPEEALQLEKEAKAGGIWSRFRNPILIILLAIIVFLSITQRESLSSLLSFLAPMLALIPVLVRAFGALSSAKATAKASQE